MHLLAYAYLLCNNICTTVLPYYKVSKTYEKIDVKEDKKYTSGSSNIFCPHTNQTILYVSGLHIAPFGNLWTTHDDFSQQHASFQWGQRICSLFAGVSMSWEQDLAHKTLGKCLLNQRAIPKPLLRAQTHFQLSTRQFYLHLLRYFKT